MNTIALRSQRWEELIKLLESIKSSDFYKKVVFLSKLSYESIKTGDNTALKNFMIELASAFFKVEVEEEHEKQPNKRRKRKKVVKRIFKIIVFPAVLIYIALAVVIEKNKKKQKKIKNKNIYIRT